MCHHPGRTGSEMPFFVEIKRGVDSSQPAQVSNIWNGDEKYMLDTAFDVGAVLAIKGPLNERRGGIQAQGGDDIFSNTISSVV